MLCALVGNSTATLEFRIESIKCSEVISFSLASYQHFDFSAKVLQKRPEGRYPTRVQLELIGPGPGILASGLRGFEAVGIRHITNLWLWHIA
jgi:hypothetical protein